MARMTVLDMTQDILSDMNSDGVNSIGDTIEAQQVANIIRSTFYNCWNDRMWPHTGSLLRFNSSADSSKPTHMILADTLIRVEWVRYNSQLNPGDKLNYSEVQWREPREFLEVVMNRNPDNDNVETVFDYNGTPLLVLNDQNPTFYTSFDDEHLVFDSYNAAVDSILQHNKVQAFGYTEPTFEMRDDYVPDIPAKAFPYFLAEAKSACFLKIKEVFSQKDEQASTRQKNWLTYEKHRANGGHIHYPDYGRRGPRTSRRDRW